MISIISLLSVVACFALAARLLAFHRLIAGLTILGSWQWAFLSVPALVASSIACAPAVQIENGWRTLLQYLAAVVMLAPPVCTLGARKPGIAAWHWFVVLPMLLVLSWPAITQVYSSRGLESLQLGAPAIIGIGLVMFMSLGTGFGTEMFAPAVLSGLAMCCCLGPSTGWSFVPAALPVVSPWFLLWAGRIATDDLQRIRSKLDDAMTVTEATDHAWHLFQYCYGLPWSRRFQDRVNQFASRERWTVTLNLAGFRSPDGQAVSDEQLELPLKSFCWVLQRFASDEWIERSFVRFRPELATSMPDSEFEG